MATRNMDFAPDFKNNQLLNVLLQLLAAPPTAIQGKMFLDTADEAFKVCVDGTNWDTLALVSQLSEAGVSLETVIDTLGTTVLTEGTNVTITYDDAANSGTGGITIAVEGVTANDVVGIEDAVAAVITSGTHTGLDASYDGVNNVDLEVTDSPTVGGATPAQLRDRTTHTGTQASTTISDFAEAVRDTIGTALVAGDNIDVTVNDAGDTITIAVEALTSADITDMTEAVQDIIGGMVGGNTETNIAVTYNDTTGKLDFNVSIPADFVASVTDTATLDLTVTGGALSGAVLDSPTVAGATPAQLRDRSTHTGTQASTTISDFESAVNALAAAQVAALVDSAPGTLDTLNELAAALGDDPNFATTITNSLAERTQAFVDLYGDGVATSFPIAHGLATVAPTVTIIEVATGAEWSVPWVVTDANTVTINHTITPTADQFRVVVLGRAD